MCGTLSCSSCGTTAPVKNFRPVKNTARGYAYSCIKCEQEKRRQRHLRDYQPRHQNARAPAGSRWCPSCETYHAVSEFRFSEKEGRHVGYCRNCHNMKRRLSYRQNSEPKTMNAFAPPDQSWCPNCEAYHPRSEFYYSKGRRSGYCRSCMKEYRRQQK